jgi:amino acid permease
VKNDFNVSNINVGETSPPTFGLDLGRNKMTAHEQDKTGDGPWLEMNEGIVREQSSVLTNGSASGVSTTRQHTPIVRGRDDLAGVFRARHIQMMALGKVSQVRSSYAGSAMATGLFLASSDVLYECGPVSMLLAYLLAGSISYAVLVLNDDHILLLMP